MPLDWNLRPPLDNLAVESNSAAVAEVSNAGGGHLEFWSDEGIGTDPSGEPDWTLEVNATEPAIRTIRVFVQYRPGGGSPCHCRKILGFS